MSILSDIDLLLTTPPSKPMDQKSPINSSHRVNNDYSDNENTSNEPMTFSQTAAPLKAAERHPLRKAL